MNGTAERVLFSEARIEARVAELAREIARAAIKPEVAVPVLNGAFVFAADLLRALAREGLDLATEFISLRSYGAGQTPGAVKVLVGPGTAVRGRNILLIDGVLDSGGTLAKASQLLMEAGAISIVSAVAVAKTYPDAAFRADHALFTAGSEFLYGYGMDAGGHARGLPDIRVRTSA